MATPDPKTTSAEDLRPTTDSFMFADYEFAIDRAASTIELDGLRVRTLVVQGDAEVFRELASDDAFPFDFAGEAPILYATGIADDANGGPAEHVSSDDVDPGDGSVHGAYLQFGEAYPVDLALIHSEGWVIVEGTVEMEGNTYGVEVRLGVG